MITSWTLASFKSVRARTELPFAALTIFAGPNSSGKSTWIQSILMISQTLAHKIGTRSVVLNGALARLGQFDDLRSFDSPEKHITIGWECRPLTPEDPRPGVAGYPSTPPRYTMPPIYPTFYVEAIESVSCELSFDTGPSPTRRETELTQLHPNLLSCRLSCFSRNEEQTEVRSTARITRATNFRKKETDLDVFLTTSEAENKLLRDSLQYDAELDDDSLDQVRETFPSATIQGCTLRHFLPERLTVSMNAVEERARVTAAFLQTGNVRFIRSGQFSEQELIIPPEILVILREKVGTLLPPAALESGPPSWTVRDWLHALRPLSPTQRHRLNQEIQKITGLANLIAHAAGQGLSNEKAVRSVPVPDELREAASYLDYLFTTSISYLGPLRDEPKPVYPLPASPDMSYVGLKGEYTAAVLDLYKNRYVDYISPTQFSTTFSSPKVMSIALQTAVTEWLQYLGVAESVQTKDQGKLGHELRVKTAGVSQVHDLTHAGVGLSQVLPILVTCLLGKSDTTLLIEQPELHLHPSVQSRLGDFFLSMALLGKQCIIETHSEYLINRLRFRIASAADELPIASMTKIYFVEKERDASAIREVSVNEFGAIPNWPDGFFDQSQSEAEGIIRAASAKRSRSKTTPSEHAKRND